MDSVKIAFKLEGDNIPLDVFVEAITAFQELIETLTDEVSDMPLDWDVAELKKGSALLATAVFREEQLEEAVKVDTAYNDVGRAVSVGNVIPFSDRVGDKVRALSRVVRGDVKGISLIPSSNVVYFVDRQLDQVVSKVNDKSHTFGTLTGLAGTLSARYSIKLTLYDELFDRAVYCYLAESQAEQARRFWNTRVTITGLIYRDPDTGRPIEIKNISDIADKPYGDPQSFYQLRGLLKVGEEHSLPDETVHSATTDDE